MKIANNKIHFGKYSAEELLDQFGSPLYVYEKETLVRQYERLKDAFKDSDLSILFACKANSNIEILKVFKNLGSGIDAISPGEVYLALLAGFKPEQILLTATNLTRDDIEYVLDKNIIVNIDNISMLEEHGELFAGREVSIRINPDIRAGGHSYLETGHRDSKFGLVIEETPRAIELLAKHDATVVGLHQHIGSDITDAGSLLESLDKILAVTLTYDSLRFIDIGGGFKVKYHEDDSETDIADVGSKVSRRFNEFCQKNNRTLQLMIEPGKFLVSESGFLLTKVQSIKRSGKKIIVGTDTGMNHLIRPALYNAYHKIVNASRVDGIREKIDIVGNICESADVLGQERDISGPKVGDTLCIFNAGSYGYSMASTYNARMLPAEILIEKEIPRLIRRRQQHEDLLCFNPD